VPLMAIPLGLLIGLSLGALGGGGSILTVPALVYGLGQDPPAATTSSLLVVGASSLIALVPHALAHRVRAVQGLLFGAIGTAGSLAGTTLSSNVPPQVLLTAFAALMLLVAALMLRRSRTTPDPASQHDPSTSPLLTLRPHPSCDCPRLAKVLLTATAVGLLTGFFGVGGGFALVPALALALGFPIPTAIGTSLLVIALNSATALAARLGTGTTQLNWALIGIFTTAAITGSLLGGRLSTRANPEHLTRAFATLLIAVALYTAAHSLPTLL
jgi:uncharacterized membrane protein YfcA